MAVGENYLFITDLQIPFHHPGALRFCRYVKKHFKIKDENCLCAGDETDQYFGGMWKHSPDATHTPNSELEEARETLRKWYASFPLMKLAISNHGTRYWRKATEAEIPSQMIRSYREIINAPKGWIWKKHWIINGSKKKFLIEHGDDWGGQVPHKVAALHNGISTAIGHHHSIAGIEFIKTNYLDIWGMCGGALIDFEQYAFEYARKSKLKPVITLGLILDGGMTPLILPYQAE